MATSCTLRFNRSSFVGPASCDEVSRKNDCLSGKSDNRSSSPADRLHRSTALSRFAVTIGKGYDDVTRRVGIVVDQPVTGFPHQLRRPSTAIPFHADQDNFPCQRLCGAVRASPTPRVQDEYRRRSLPGYSCYLRFVASFLCCRIGETIDLRQFKRVAIFYKFGCLRLRSLVAQFHHRDVLFAHW